MDKVLEKIYSIIVIKTMKSLCLYYFIIIVAYLTLLAPYIFKSKKVCVFFQTHGEIDLEVKTIYEPH